MVYFYAGAWREGQRWMKAFRATIMFNHVKGLCLSCTCRYSINRHRVLMPDGASKSFEGLFDNKDTKSTQCKNSKMHYAPYSIHIKYITNRVNNNVHIIYQIHLALPSRQNVKNVNRLTPVEVQLQFCFPFGVQDHFWQSR